MPCSIFANAKLRILDLVNSSLNIDRDDILNTLDNPLLVPRSEAQKKFDKLIQKNTKKKQRRSAAL
jgi:hypothetical protein